MRTWVRQSRRATALGVFLFVAFLAVTPAAIAGAWHAAGSMTAARNLPMATLLLDGTVLVTGGEGYQDGAYHFLASAERFDPATNLSAPQGPMTVARYGHAAVRLADGRVLLLGGLDDELHVLDSAELFDPATGRFIPTGPLSAPREGMTATLLRDGRVLVVGGDDGEKGLATTELYDPAAGTFQATGSLATPRVGHAAAALPEGRVVILGGGTGRGAAVPDLLAVEIYDPASGSFRSQGEITEGRLAASATLLPNRKLLLTGGLVPARRAERSGLAPYRGAL